MVTADCKAARSNHNHPSPGLMIIDCLIDGDTRWIMNKLKKLFPTYQLPLFFLLTYLLSWISAPFMNGQLLPHGPAFAAVIVIAGATGLAGLWRWLRRNIRHTGAWYWYLIGPAIILGYQGAAFFINLLLGASIVQPPQILPTAVFLELLLLGGAVGGTRMERLCFAEAPGAIFQSSQRWHDCGADLRCYARHLASPACSLWTHLLV
jgi:hypothetical protein